MHHGDRHRSHRLARRSAPRVALAFAVVAGSAIIVTDSAAALTTWAPGDAAQVVAVTVDAEGNRQEVTVSWPEPTGDFDGFELRRDGVPVASVDATTFTATDPAPVAGPSTYTVVATLGGVVDGQLPAATVAFPWFAPSGVITCTLLWTGAASPSWHDPRNWAPYGEAGFEGPVRVPTTSDTVCVDHQAAVPIEVTDAGATALAFIGTQDGTAPLRMLSGGLTLTQPSVIPAIELLGGQLDLQADTRLIEADRPTLLLGGGHLSIGGQLIGQISLGSNVVGGTVTAVPGTSSILAGGQLTTRSLDLDLNSSVSVEGRNGHITTVLGRTGMSGATTFAAGTGGATLHTFELAATSGTNRVDWALAGGDGGAPVRVTVEAGETRLTDLVDLTPAARVLPSFSATVDGTLLLDEDVEVIDTVELRGSGQLRVGGRPGNLEGIVEATSLSLDGTPPITIDSTFRAARVRLDGGSELTVTGELSSYLAFEMNSAELLDGALTVGGGWHLEESAVISVVGAPGKPFVYDGDLLADGSVNAAYYEDPFDEQDDSPVYGATFEGAVTLSELGAWTLSVTSDAADQPELTVEGVLTVDGALIVTVPSSLPETFERRLVTAANLAFDPIEVVIVDQDGEEVEDVRVEERPTGIYAVRGEPGPAGEWGAGAAVEVTSMTVDAAGSPVAVALAWPDPTTPFDGFQVRRGDEVIATLGAASRAAVDGAPVTGPTVYSVVGLSGGSPAGTITSAPVVFPSDPTCTLVWSGEVSDEWGVAGNWSPIGLAGSEGSARVPSPTDHACVPQPTPTFISVNSTVATAAQLSGPQADLNLIEGSLTAGDVTVRSLFAPTGFVDADAVTAGEVYLGFGSSLIVDSVTLAGDVDELFLAMDGATLTSASPVVVPSSAAAVLRGDVTIDATLEVDGTLAVGLAFEPFGEVVAITGDLRLGDGARTEMLVLWGGEAAYAPQTVEVGGALTLGGELAVEVGLPLPDPFEWLLFSADQGPITGSFEPITLTGEADGARVEVVSDGVALLRGDGTPGEWGTGALPQVRGLTVSGSGDPQSITIAWPDPTLPFAFFELRRNGEWAATGGPDVRQLTDSSPVAGPAVYTVVGINPDGSEAPIATAPVVVPNDPSCSTVWVGTAGERWDDQRNWAPMGVFTLGGDVRVPTESDHVCIPQDTRVLVADTPAVADRITAAAADLDVSGVALTAGDVTVRTLDVAYGRVTAGVATAEQIDLGFESELDVAAIVWSGALSILAMRNATLTSSAPIVMPESSLVAFDETVSLNGSLVADGLVSLGADSDQTWVFVSGDLTLGSDASTQVRAYSSESVEAPGSPPFVGVEGQLTLGGDLTVEVVAELPDPYLWALLGTEAPVAGSFGTITLTGQSADARVDVLADGVYLARGDLPQGEWAVGALPQVAALTVDAGGAPAAVTVTWPVPVETFASYELRRDDVVVSTTGPLGSSAVDPSPVPGPAVYTVVGVNGDGSEAPIATAPVVFPGDATCSIVWVGTAGQRWDDQRNWAPMGQAGLEGPVRTPTSSDHVCIPQDTRVLAADTPAVADRITGADAVLSVFGVALTTGDVTVRGIEVGGGRTRTAALVTETIEIGLGGELFTSSVSLIGASPRITLNDGELGAPAPIVVDDGDVSLDGESTVSGSLELTGTTTLSIGSSDATALISVVGDLGLAVDGATIFTVDPDRPPTLYVEGDTTLAGALLVDLAAELPDPFEWPLVVAESQLLGTFADIVLSGETAGARVEVFPDAIGLFRSSPRWADGDALQVTAVTVDGDGDLVSVGLSWPEMSSYPSTFEVVRTALGVDTVIGTLAGDAMSFVDTDPLPDAEYQVRALVEGAEVDTLGDRRVVFPAVLGCSVVWTGSASGEWLDARNWAPFGVAGAEGVVRVPSLSDHACIPQPVVVSVLDESVVVGRVSGVDADVWVADAELTVGDVVVSGLQVSSGTVRAGALVADEVDLDGASLVVESVEFTGSSSVLEMQDATLESQQVVVLPAGVNGFFDGSVVVSGSLDVADGLLVGLSAGSSVSVTGDLVVRPSATVLFRADFGAGGAGAGPTSLVVDGDVLLGGELRVELVSALGDGFEWALVRSGSSLSGGFASTTLLGESAGARIETRADGVYLVRSADGCGEAPDANGVDVGGCWRDNGDDTYSHDDSLVEQPGDEPSLGGIELDPAAGTELTLDLTDPAAPVVSADGPVDVTIDVQPRGGSAESWTITDPAMSWSLGGDTNPLPVDTVLGLPATPAIVNDGGTLRLRAAGTLPAPFDGAPVTVDVPVTGGAIAPAASAPATSLGGVLVPTDLALSYLGGSRWSVGDDGPGIELAGDVTFLPDGRIGAGSLDLGNTDLTGLGGIDGELSFDGGSRTWNADLGTGRSVRFTEGTGGRLGAGSFVDLGPIDLGFFRIDGPTRIARNASGLWQLPNVAGPADVVQGIELGFDRGRLEIGELRFGDLDPLIDAVPTLGDVAGWLPLGGLEAGYDPVRDVWFVNAYLDEPERRVSGEVGFEDGALATGALAIDAVEIGGLAQLDLRLAITGPGTFEIDATVLGAAFDGARSGSGSLTFVDGDLTRGRLELERLPIGDLFVIDDLLFDYDTATATTWTASGSVAAQTDGAVPAEVDGSIGFTDGVLTSARLEMRDVGFGPSTIDLLSFELDRTAASGPRESSYRVAGQARGPRPVDAGGAGGPAPLEPITGSASILDGRLTAFSVTIPSLEIPGLAYLRDISVGYQQTGTTARLNGTGAVRTATSGSSFTAGSFEADLDDGRVQRLWISAPRLDLAGALTVESFEAAYQRSAPIASCPGLRGGDPATIYALSGTVNDSQLTGCVAMAGRSLVGALLTVDQLRIADLVTIEGFRAQYASSTTYVVSQIDTQGRDAGPATLRRTSLDVGGRVIVGSTQVQVDGSLELTDGGVSQLDLAISTIPLSATFALTDVAIGFQAGARFGPAATRSYSISGNAVHDRGTTSAAGALAYNADGRVQTANLAITELPLGPVTLEEFTFAYNRTTSQTEWLAGARVTTPDDPSVVVDVTGQARFTEGRLTFAQLDVPAFSVGELVSVTNLQLAFERFSNGSERWSGTGGVAGLGQATDPATATVRIDIGANGRFSSGLIEVGHVRWGGLFHIVDLRLSGSRNTTTGLGVWSATGEMSIGRGAISALSGSLTLRDGRAVAGSLSVTNLGIAGVATIEQLSLLASSTGGNTTWAVDGSARIGNGQAVRVGGELEWQRGRLERALLSFGNVPVGELFRIDDFRIEYVDDTRWTAAGTIVDEDGTSTLGGELTFTDGVVSGGELQIANLQWGPLDLVSGRLRVDTTGTPGAAVCGHADGPGDGTRFSIEATLRAGDGSTTSLAGRIRLDAGRVTEGALCASDVKFADFLVLDDFNVRLAQSTGPGPTRTEFSGSATAATPGRPPASVSVAFALQGRRLQTLDVAVGQIVFGDLLTLRNASLTYDRATTGTNFAFSATVAQTNGDATFAGSLGITDGIITSGSLTLSQLRFGDSFTLNSLQIAYYGRALPSTPTSAVTAGGTNNCAATPTDTNMPSGVPRGTGRWSQFSIAATVEANGRTYAASGSMLFGDGDLQGFDISLACLPIGDFKTLEGVRIAKRPGSALGGSVYQFAGRIRDDQGTSGASGFFSFQDGRLAGGEIELNRVPFGSFQVHQIRAALGENVNGDTQYALTVVVQQGDNAPVGAGGSLTMRNGRVIAGSIRIDGLRLLNLFTIDRFDLMIDGSTPGTVRLNTALQVSGNNTPSPGQVAASLTMVEGRVTAGSFVIGGVKLFDAIPIGRVAANFDSAAQRWGFEIRVQLGATGPSLVVAADFQRGRVVAGALGFDIDGDGVPDGAPGATPPAGGSADMDWFPVRALYVSFCSAGSTASYCLGNGVSSWSGRIGIELPTDNAPALDMQLRVVDGAFDYASATLSFGNPGLAVYPAVFLTSISGSMSRNPWVFAGGLGLGIGAPTLVSINGELAIGEGPPRPANVSPADYEAEYIFFASRGSANIPLPGISTQIEASNVFQSNGFIGLGVRGELEFGPVGVEGGVEGAVFNASGAGMNLTHPRTGARLTGWHAQVRGFVEGSIFGTRVAAAEGYVNTIGAYAQASFLFFNCLGGGMYWSDGSTTPTCDQSRYAIEGVSVTNNPNLPRLTNGLSGRLTQSVQPTYQFSEFDVAAGEEVLGVEVLGTGSELDRLAPAPDAALRSPTGRIYRLGDHDPDGGVIVHDTANKRWFFIADPTPGRWLLETSATSAPISQVFLSRTLPDVDVRGTITRSGRDVLLDYRVVEIPGQQVLFSERAVGGDPFEAVIGTAPGTSGRIRFTPSGSATGGTREVVATVLQNGFTRREIVIGTYTAPDAVPAGAPRSLTVREIAAGATVTWQPPASNGGRRITSYRITSDIGWSVSVPAELDGTYRGDLPIPALEPGETVNVYVQARTGLGWGDPAVASFTATQTTGWQYRQGEVPQTNRPDLGGGLVDPPAVVDPTPAPTNPAPTDPAPTTTVPLARDLPRSGSSAGPTGFVWALVIVAVGLAIRGGARRRSV